MCILFHGQCSDEDMSHHDYGWLGRRKRSSGATNTDQSHDTPRHKGNQHMYNWFVTRKSMSYMYMTLYIPLACLSSYWRINNNYLPHDFLILWKLLYLLYIVLYHNDGVRCSGDITRKVYQECIHTVVSPW